MGDLVPGTPWLYLPHAARLYCRENQLPAGETFQAKTARAVELLRQADAASSAPLLAVFDGAYAVATVVETLCEPPSGATEDGDPDATAGGCTAVSASGVPNPPKGSSAEVG
jgi:hypothetical protein